MHNKRIPERVLNDFHVLAKNTNKFDCLIKEMIFIRQQKPEENVQSDSVSAKVLVFNPFRPSCIVKLFKLAPILFIEQV